MEGWIGLVELVVWEGRGMPGCQSDVLRAICFSVFLNSLDISVSFHPSYILIAPVHGLTLNRINIQDISLRMPRHLPWTIRVHYRRDPRVG